MPPRDFQKVFPKVNKISQWFLDEILYCLQHYAGMTEDAAYSAITSSKGIQILLADDPSYIETEPGFYWAMCIVHGFGSPWWHDKELWAQHRKYVMERHHPPIGE